MNIQEVGVEGMDWIDLAQNRDKCFCECGSESSVSIQCEEFLE
jgi:hypothetical protein